MENAFETVGCDLCGGGAAKTFLPLEDHLFGVPGSFRVARCSSCGFLFTSPRPMRADLKRLYETYYVDHESSSALDQSHLKSELIHRPSLRRLYHSLFGNYLAAMLREARGRVLDIGCGTGNILKEMEALGLDAYGIEPNPKAAEACAKKGLRVVQGTLEETRFQENSFDTVILWHVIEHVPSPSSLLDAIYPILKPGGQVFICCPNAESYMAAMFKPFWAGWHMPFHFSHFTPETMKSLILKKSFQPVRIRAVTPDFLFPQSLEAFRRQKKDGKRAGLRRLGSPRMTRSLPFRAMAALTFRLLDSLFPGKGECLQVKIMKSEDSHGPSQGLCRYRHIQ